MRKAWFGPHLPVGIALVFTNPALAHDMSEPNAEWYRSLTVPGAPGEPMAGSPCCTGGSDKSPDVDCKNVEIRYRNGHIEAYADSKTFPDLADAPLLGHAPNDWVRVPEGVIIHRSNPTGRPVGCWFNRVWRCFVMGTDV